MEYLVAFLIILIFSAMLSILFKKKIEEVIPISIVEIILIIFLAGLFGHLEIGLVIVEILMVIQSFIILILTWYKAGKGKVKEIKEAIKRIITPGLFVYMALFVINVIINQGRILEDYDEYTHWGVIIKNMFMYNTYGTNPESVVRFNEYPPFTAVFQYFFLGIQKVYREDTIIIAQNILYLSIIIPITRTITRKKNLKKLLMIVPIIVFLPMIFYDNFFLEILADGMLGIMFAYLMFAAFDKEENIKFKTLKIFTRINYAMFN